MGNRTKRICGLLATLALAAQAQVQTRPQIDLTALDRGMAGPRTQLLVLGTVHLSELPAGFNPAALNGVRERLAAFKPDIITIEALPGEECELALRFPAKYGADYCAPTDAAKAATGLDIPAAMAEVNKTLKAWPAEPAPAQRRRLAALFLAANDRASAYVQWLQLPETERRADEHLNAAVVELLAKVATRNNEDFQLAARLAARLGLQRVYAVDNHTGDNIDVPDVKAYVQQLEAAWAAGRSELNEKEKQEQVLKQASDLLPLYRFVNDPEYLRILTDVNVREPMRAKSPEGYPQMFVAGWEVRNLRMVANIRETFRERRGARVLSIVGASHKPWFDAWLGQLQGVEIVDVAGLLK
ncbi:DUF5694 domain-containing protein [Roseateles oligotrophus]|uniref:DUF5694 domain-containing protein n=1 Tax=Roseateles oligotrophus TaxID=1769250 RepID=A0ABT2Y8I2_9BURK|nr:DUF5694 domain-containing protein [Roseateles oligotrophus]MCV2366598.1 DUF5694 domain-containing protein [Roseateles oligotrophus]